MALIFWLLLLAAPAIFIALKFLIVDNLSIPGIIATAFSLVFFIVIIILSINILTQVNSTLNATIQEYSLADLQNNQDNPEPIKQEVKMDTQNKEIKDDTYWFKLIIALAAIGSFLYFIIYKQMKKNVDDKANH